MSTQLQVDLLTLIGRTSNHNKILDLTDERVNRKLTLRKQKLSNILTNRRMKLAIMQKNDNKDNKSLQSTILLSKLNQYASDIKEFARNLYAAFIGIKKLLSNPIYNHMTIDYLETNNTFNDIIQLMPKLNNEPFFISEIIWIITNSIVIKPDLTDAFLNAHLINNTLYLFNSSSSEFLSHCNIIEEFAQMLFNISVGKMHINIKHYLNQNGIVSFFINHLKNLTDNTQTLQFLHHILIDITLLHSDEELKLVSYLLRIIDDYIGLSIKERINIEITLRTALKIIRIITIRNLDLYQYFSENNGIGILCKLIDCNDKIAELALKIIGDYSDENNSLYLVILLKNHIIEHFSIILQNNTINKEFKQNLLWTLENLTLTEENVQMFYENGKIIDIVFNLLQKEQEEDSAVNQTNKSIFFFISKITISSRIKNIQLLINHGYLELVSYYLWNKKDNEMILIALEGLCFIIELISSTPKKEETLPISNRITKTLLGEQIQYLVINNNQSIASHAEYLMKWFNEQCRNDDQMELS